MRSSICPVCMSCVDMKEVGMHMKGWCTATANRTWFWPFHLSHLSDGHVWAAHAELSVCRWCDRAQNRKAVAKKTVAAVERCLMPPAMHMSAPKWASVASVWPVGQEKRREAKRGLLGGKVVIFHARAYSWWCSLIFSLSLHGNRFDPVLPVDPTLSAFGAIKWSLSQKRRLC